MGIIGPPTAVLTFAAPEVWVKNEVVLGILSWRSNKVD
jgi:hypothetical protein